MSIVTSVDGLVGNTPVFSFEERGAEILVKLESYNPGGSVKDRAALAIIEQAEKAGALQPGGVIVEPTSGNMGVALAMIGVSRGYRVIIVMPDTMTLERRKLITAFGGELVLTEGAQRMTGAMQKAEELAREIPGAFMPQQFENMANPASNEAAGHEILRDTEGRLDAFVAGIGTGGSFTGISRVLKKELPSVLCIAIEPAESAVIAGKRPGPHGIQGIGAGFLPKTFDRSLADRVMPVPTSEAMRTACWFTKTFGILVGISSGAAVYVARKLAREMGADKRILCLAPDTGERYLSVLYNR